MRVTTRKSGAERREEIAKAVLRIVGERGESALSTTNLAAEIGVTSGALFRHFSTRDEILAAAVQYAIPQMEATFPDESLPPLERLMQLARNRVSLLGSDSGLAWLLRSDQAYHALPEDAVKQLRNLVRRSKRYLLSAIREGAKQGTIRGDIEPEVLLVLVTGTVHAMIGMPGVHRPSSPGRGANSSRVLAALEQILAAHTVVRSRRQKSKSKKR